MFKKLALIITLATVAAGAQAAVKITQDEQYRYITSDGLPDHGTGAFPHRDNPNSIKAQVHRFRMPLTPIQAVKTTNAEGKVFGVGLNGVTFDPATAECFGQTRGRQSPSSCAWKEEAIVGQQKRLGLDFNNAHVQPNGTYHYHGIPTGLLDDTHKDLVHVGYAADGFKIMVSQSGRYKPSYQLKQGLRPSGPIGRYNGTYTQDFEFIESSGDLDRCNGLLVEGRYVYIVTETFPFIPRCWVGAPDQSFFKKRAPSSGNISCDVGRGPRHDHLHPHGRHHPPRRY